MIRCSRPGLQFRNIDWPLCFGRRVLIDEGLTGRLFRPHEARRHATIRHPPPDRRSPRDAPGNHAFYTQTLGMRLVKKTVNQDDTSAPTTSSTPTDRRRPAPTSPSSIGRSSASGAARDSIVRTACGSAGQESLAWWLRPPRRKLSVSHGDIVERDGRPDARFRGSRRPASLAHRRRRRRRRRIPGTRARCRPSTRSAVSDRSPSASPTCARPTPC